MTDIIIPHKSTYHNDKALELCIEAIEKYTKHPYRIVVNKTSNDPYHKMNDSVMQSDAENIILTSSDMIFAPDWDLMLDYVEPNCITSGYLLEPGVVGVASQNVHMDFGRTPDSFTQELFNEWVNLNKDGFSLLTHDLGWYQPVAMNRQWFVDMGMYPTDKGTFPYVPVDMCFWDICYATPGFKLNRVRSFAYHFQVLSDENKIR